MIKLKKSKIHRYGVFAEKPFRTGQLIEESPFLFVDEKTITGELADYVFYYSKKRSALALLHGSLFNHSDNPNVWFQVNGKLKIITFKATRAIAIGEELLIDYGKEYWEGKIYKK